MNGRNGQELLSTWVPADLAAAFKARARQMHGGAAAALRQLVAASVGQEAPEPHAVGHGEQVSVRLKEGERAALAKAASQRSTTPANWLRSLALVHLARRPQWNPAELEALRELFKQLRAIGNNVNQIAHALNATPYTGREPPIDDVLSAVREANERLRLEMRRVVTVMTGNFAYWGLPESDRPKPMPGAIEEADRDAQAVEIKRKVRSRRQPARFAANKDA